MVVSGKGFFRGIVDKITGTEAGNDGAVDERGKETAKPGFFERLKNGLSKTHETIVGKIDSLLLGKKKIDSATLEGLEEILISADIGVSTTMELIALLEQRLKRNELSDGETLKRALREEVNQVGNVDRDNRVLRVLRVLQDQDNKVVNVDQINPAPQERQLQMQVNKAVPRQVLRVVSHHAINARINLRLN